MRIWKKNDTIDFVNVRKLTDSIGINFFDLIQYFFSCTSNKVTMHSFLLFVILFGFFSPEELIPCLVCISGASSHCYITPVYLFYYSKKHIIS